ncbi:protein Shroom-like isoform X2 [Microplitis mediator]|uniref:protein Shroom-like isoform X2 n=1 Tax=Microplitis mediator TaxID=375433 RepID=UPI002552C312|nr:protein Shroom-like isoform X2 [Microplitis mediator]
MLNFVDNVYSTISEGKGHGGHGHSGGHSHGGGHSHSVGHGHSGSSNSGSIDSGSSPLSDYSGFSGSSHSLGSSDPFRPSDLSEFGISHVGSDGDSGPRNSNHHRHYDDNEHDYSSGLSYRSTEYPFDSTDEYRSMHELGDKMATNIEEYVKKYATNKKATTVYDYITTTTEASRVASDYSNSLVSMAENMAKMLNSMKASLKPTGLDRELENLQKINNEYLNNSKF